MSACVTWLDLLSSVFNGRLIHPNYLDNIPLVMIRVDIYPLGCNIVSKLSAVCSQSAQFLFSLVTEWTWTVNGCNVCQCISSALRFQGFLWPAPAASNSKHSEQKARGWHKKFARFHAIQDNMCTIRQKFCELFALAWHSAQTVNRHLETFLFSLNKLSPVSQFLLIIFRNAIDN